MTGPVAHAEALAEMRRRMDAVAGGLCPTCRGRLELDGAWAVCLVCGHAYQVTVEPDGSRRYVERLIAPWETPAFHAWLDEP